MTNDKRLLGFQSYISRVPGIGVMLLVLMFSFAILAPGFSSTNNLANILSQASILMLVSLPMTLIIMTEGMDLSVGAVVSLASVALALTVTNGGSIFAAIGVAILIGLIFGSVNAILVAGLSLPPFVATLGVLGVAQGLALVITDGQVVTGLPTVLRDTYESRYLGLPVPFLVAALAILGFYIMLYRTPFGLRVFALGGNREALRVAGLPVRQLLASVYLIAGIFAGLAAVLTTSRLNSGHPTSSIGLEFEAIAAVAIGGTSFARGDGRLFGTVLGVLTVGVLRNGLNLLAIHSAIQVAAVGALVIVALAIDSFRNRKQ
jgi:ribose transport system permease protein